MRQRHGADLARAPRLVSILQDRDGVHRTRLAVAEPVRRIVNGRVRDELLDVEEFSCLAEARVVIEDWRRDYNHYRPTARSGCAPRPRSPPPCARTPSLPRWPRDHAGGVRAAAPAAIAARALARRGAAPATTAAASSEHGSSPSGHSATFPGRHIHHTSHSRWTDKRGPVAVARSAAPCQAQRAHARARSPCS